MYFSKTCVLISSWIACSSFRSHGCYGFTNTLTTEAHANARQKSNFDLFAKKFLRKSKAQNVSYSSSYRMMETLDQSELSSEEIERTPKNEKMSNGSKLEGRLKKQLRQTSLKYKMIEDGDHIMCCVSGGKDSATLLFLLCALQKKLKGSGVNFKITAVHLNQMQPGYDGKPLVEWLDNLVEDGSLDEYKIITEDTYSVVIDKTPENKVYCSMCSRLRRGILYSVAHDISANKIALGHHGDDAIQTLLLNFIHAGQMKAMPARYYSTSRDIHVIRPLMGSLEDDIEKFAKAMDFPILPCNLCGTQPQAQRAKVGMLVDTLTMLNPNAKKNMINAMENVRPSHLLDVDLRKACGIDGATGEVLDEERAALVKATDQKPDESVENSDEYISKSRIDSLL